ncbi:hypothetical protein CLOP_g9248 [Closterium sp. NIES-67]|nr:hypothetical protein CLOP_g9248 [Closterium sp. NIES-67]
MSTIQKSTGIPISQQMLLHEGRWMRPFDLSRPWNEVSPLKNADRLLSDYNVGPGAVIVLAFLDMKDWRARQERKLAA